MALLAFGLSEVSFGAHSEIPNPSFELGNAQNTFAANLSVGIGGEADAQVIWDKTEARDGTCSIRIENNSSFEAFVLASLVGEPIAMAAETTYVVRFWVRGCARA